MTTIPTFTDLLKGAKLPEASHDICLRADLVADFERAEAALEAARKGPRRDSLDAGSEVAELVAQIEGLQEEMRAGTQTFRMRALPKAAWRRLVAAFPPREGNAEDAQIGVNRDDFLPAMLKACVIDPEITDEQWVMLIGDGAEEDGKLTDRQFSDFADEIWFLNRGEVSVPFSRAVSLVKRDSESE
ncbi:MAG: hypothetical protein ABW022_10190 [Actinoplanes sp.]